MNTKEKILACAERLIQLNGYNGFSYKHIAEEIGIKTSSIHYHFDSKEVLANEVIGFHLEKLLAVIERLDGNNALDAKDKLLQAVSAIYTLTYYDHNKMCLAGMLASDVNAIPESIRQRITQFFDVLRTWLTKEISNRLTSEQASFEAQVILSQLEGGLLLARLYEDKDYLNNLLRYIKHIMEQHD